MLGLAVIELGITDVEYLLAQIGAIKTYLSRHRHRPPTGRW